MSKNSNKLASESKRQHNGNTSSNINTNAWSGSYTVDEETNLKSKRLSCRRCKRLGR